MREKFLSLLSVFSLGSAAKADSLSLPLHLSMGSFVDITFDQPEIDLLIPDLGTTCKITVRANQSIRGLEQFKSQIRIEKTGVLNPHELIEIVTPLTPNILTFVYDAGHWGTSLRIATRNGETLSQIITHSIRSGQTNGVEPRVIVAQEGCN